MDPIYLDYSATTPIDKDVIDAMMPYFRGSFGNASSIHSYGREAREAMEGARDNLANLIKAQPEDIFFTSGGTEADNWAVVGFAQDNIDKGNHIVTAITEHAAVIKSCEYLESKGFNITYLEVDIEGNIDLDQLKNSITSKTILISLMHINNEIGLINDLEAIGAIAKDHGVVLHTDAVQSFGKIPIDVNKMNIGMLSASAHKIYGPKGIGILYKRSDVNLSKMIHGGSHEKNMRSGTENVSSIVGFGEAIKICINNMEQEELKIRELRNYFWELIQAKIPDTKLNGAMKNRLPGNLNVSFKDADGESVLLSLDLHGVAASSGSACAAGGIEPSHVIIALGLPPEYGQSAIRFTLGRYTTKDHIDYTVQVLIEVVDRIRSI